MNRTTFLAATSAFAASSTLPAIAQTPTAEDANISTSGGTIAGTLERPAPPSRTPVVLLIAGSGAIDRDGNGGSAYTTFNTLKQLALGLADRGIASLRYDKRGIGASRAAGANEADLRFDSYVDDAVAYVRSLRARAQFTRVVIAGHSEGSLIGMLAAARAGADGFVSLEGAGRPAAAVLREQLAKQGGLTPELLATADHIIDELAAGRTVADTPRALAPLFRASVQPYVISWFRYDPAQAIAKVPGTAAIVQGTADVQVSLADAQALHAALPSARYVVVDGMNHVLKHAPNTASMQAVLAGYIDPALPIEPVVIDTIAAVARG